MADVTPPPVNVAQPTPVHPEPATESLGARIGLRVSAFSERWFPDAFTFVTVAAIVVCVAALAIGAKPVIVATQFSVGFWNLITFAMQMAFIIIGGYVVATSPPVARLISWLATLPRGSRSAVAFVAFISLATSLISWGFSLIFAGLLVRELARLRPRLDYRAAGAAAYLGVSSVWALGLSSSASQLQANPASLPKALLKITGVIPFTETIFLWQSMATAVILIVVSVVVAWVSAPSERSSKTASDFGVELPPVSHALEPRSRPGEWLEYSPIIAVLLAAIAAYWVFDNFSKLGFVLAISNLNTYNFIFVIAGLLLHWRPKRFLAAVANSVPATAGVLIQFPLYAAIAAVLTGAKGSAGLTLSDMLAKAIVSVSNQHTFPLLAAAYSGILGLFVPSGGGKWIIEAPYLMQAAKTLHVNLGWTVLIYNTAEALPNLINPFWMLPLIGVLGIKARELIGYTALQFAVHVPVVFFLMWFFAQTLPYHAPHP